MSQHIAFSIPQQKVWRRRPAVAIPIGDIVWFFASKPDGIHQECLTGIYTARRILETRGRKDGEPAEIFVIRVRQVDWNVDSSRVFEYWEDCDHEARIYSKWCHELRRTAREFSNSRR